MQQEYLALNQPGMLKIWEFPKIRDPNIVP